MRFVIFNTKLFTIIFVNRFNFRASYVYIEIIRNITSSKFALKTWPDEIAQKITEFILSPSFIILAQPLGMSPVSCPLMSPFSS